MARWFRYYDDALNDPKVQRLTPPLFKAWVNMLCIASQRDGAMPGMDELAFLLRQTAAEVEKNVSALLAAGLFDKTADGGFTPHNWHGRQYKSDVSNERVKRHRQRSSNVECNVTGNTAVTPSETDTESDTETEQKVEAPQASPAPQKRIAVATTDLPEFLDRKKGTRLPADWWPNSADFKFASDEIGKLGATDEIAKFRDYWAAKAGAGGVKLDWSATWRNWIRKAKEYGAKSGNQGKSGNGFASLAAARFSGQGGA